MGRNNIDDRSHDKNWCKNLTKKCSFKCEILDDSYTRRLELSQGLNMYKLTMSLRLNAYYDVEMNDELEIKGRLLRVTTVMEHFDNNNQGMFKANLDDYTGYKVVGLE